MTREEAIIDLKAKITRIKSILDDGLCANPDRWAIKLKWHEDMLSALHSPQPDPITGLVPCGCGGKAIMLCDLEYAVACEKCLINLPYAFDTKELARQAWNTAMCYTAPPRPGAFGPEQDRTATNGDKGAGE